MISKLGFLKLRRFMAINGNKYVQNFQAEQIMMLKIDFIQLCVEV